MAKTLGILGSASGIYVRDLQRAAMALGVDVRLLGYPELQTSINVLGLKTGHSNLDSQCVVVSDRKWSERCELDALIIRTMPLGSLEQVIFRMDCLHVWQALGVAVVNSPRCLETAIDKWLTLHRLSQAGLKVPATVVCQNRDQALDAMTVLGGDVLLKPIFGGEGRGIIRLHDPDMAWRVISTLQQLGQVLYLQQFVPNFGYDIRVLVIGEQLFSIKRVAPHGSFRSNVSLGGTAEPWTLSEVQRQIAIDAARAVGGQVVGVDLLPASDGQTYVLEVNAVPGWNGVAKSLSVNIAQEIVKYVIS